MASYRKAVFYENFRKKITIKLHIRFYLHKINLIICYVFAPKKLYEQIACIRTKFYVQNFKSPQISYKTSKQKTKRYQKPNQSIHLVFVFMKENFSSYTNERGRIYFILKNVRVYMQREVLKLYAIQTDVIISHHRIHRIHRISYIV